MVTNKKNINSILVNLAKHSPLMPWPLHCRCHWLTACPIAWEVPCSQLGPWSHPGYPSSFHPFVHTALPQWHRSLREVQRRTSGGSVVHGWSRFGEFLMEHGLHKDENIQFLEVGTLNGDTLASILATYLVWGRRGELSKMIQLQWSGPPGVQSKTRFRFEITTAHISAPDLNLLASLHYLLHIFLKALVEFSRKALAKKHNV